MGPVSLAGRDDDRLICLVDDGTDSLQVEVGTLACVRNYVADQPAGVMKQFWISFEHSHVLLSS